MLQVFFVLLLSALTSYEARAQTLPLWEVGVGALPFRSDNYRGSPQHNWYLFPLAAYTYRGKYVEAETGYVRGHFIKFGRFTLDLSVSLGLNVNSDTNKLRHGMEDLDPTFELGPILRYYLWKSDDGNHFVNLELPYRAVYTTNLKYVDHVGYYSIPYVHYLARATPSTFGWSTEFTLGLQYGSTGYHNHFYAVNSRDVSPQRDYYHSRRGYSGTQATFTVSKRINDFLIVPFFRYDYLDGAVYRESPLYKNPHYTSFGMTLMWFFAHSEKKQEAPTMVK